MERKLIEGATMAYNLPIGCTIQEFCSPQHIAVHAIKGHMIAASAEASFMPDQSWFINRVVVLPARAPRGTGLGSELVRHLLACIVDADRVAGRATRVVVTPGGYGADPEKQFNFYLKA